MLSNTEIIEVEFTLYLSPYIYSDLFQEGATFSFIDPNIIDHHEMALPMIYIPQRFFQYYRY